MGKEMIAADQATLRRLAEKTMEETADNNDDLSAKSPEDIASLVHELRVHQIELEMQNEELRRAQVEIDAARARYLDLYDLAPVGYCTLSEKGLILETNLTAATLLGTNRGELIKQPISRFILKEDQDIYYLHRKQLFETGEPQECELRMVRPDGAFIWAHQTATAAQAEDGAPVCRVVLSDITERKQAEIEKDKLENLLRQAQKMEAVGRLAGGVAHDFNNVLYMITGNAELAMEDIPEWNPVHANLKEIKSAGLRAAGIVKQLLNFSRKTDQELKPIGAVTVIKDALKFLRSTIPTSIEIQKHLPDAEVTILADPIQINQILMNICTNASQAMEETGGLLEITVETESLQDGISSNTLNIPPGEYLKVEVSDNGPGIDPEIIKRIFDPYFTTKDVGQGSGMGLAVVHGIVKNHNGAITVDSELGEGTTFAVYFPISTEKPVKEVKSSDKIPRGDESIIFVDDEKSIATMCGQMLERLGYKVETITNPTEVLELFKSNPDHFDLIITDMTMPQMSGVQLSEKLKAVRSDIPVIICTGHSSRIDEEKAKTLGINGFVMKPVVLRDIARVIRGVLDKAKR